ncbi:isoprenylcysteine carboxylmethyltransferase family protein [candidate division KSB1 bacterium]|nr:isoprenylcysteine carboxylmethyltransferase family protein [candidate division KSB1 bacterium]
MDIREKIFNYRSYTPIPLAIAVIILAETTIWSFFVGLVTAIVGESIRFWGVSYAGSATRTTSGAGGDVLVTNGAFAYVRNPLYLGNFILSLGVCIMAWAWMPWMLLLYIALFAFQYAMIISLEEDYLNQTFKDVYADYARHVPRFIPRVTPYRNRGKISPDTSAAFRSEKSTLMNIVAFSIIILVRWLIF